MTSSRWARLLAMGLAAVGLSVSVAVSLLFAAVLVDGWFALPLAAGFGIALAGVFVKDRHAPFLASYAAMLIVGFTFAAAFVGWEELALLFFLVIWGPSFLAVPWLVVQLHSLWRSAMRPPSASA